MPHKPSINPSLLRVIRITLFCALLPFSLLAGCHLYEPPIYPRLEAPPASNPIRVLFIGNSLTYYNDLPGLLGQLAAHESRPLEVDAVTAPNVSLEFHWTWTAARRHLQSGSWNYVVLQEYSTWPAKEPEATLRDFERWAPEVKKTGAELIIAENWPLHSRGDRDTAKMRRTYDQVCSQTGGTLAPLGHAWQLCAVRHPEIRLYVDDVHPTVAGTYLVACVYYRTLYGKPATGLPIAVPGLKLLPDVARVLQQVADATEK